MASSSSNISGSPSVSTSDPSQALPCKIITRGGTSRDAFNEFITQLDGGHGQQMHADVSGIHVYDVHLTDEQINWVKHDSDFHTHVDRVVVIRPGVTGDFVKPRRKTSERGTTRLEKSVDRPYVAP